MKRYNLIIFFFFLIFNSPLFAANHVIDLEIHTKDVCFAGISRQAIAVNGQIPAPTLHFKEGDHVVINVTNRLHEETAIHWHGMLVPWQMDGVLGISQRGIQPGQTFHYEFTLHQSGTYWYHAHAGLQEQQGLYGGFIIDPLQPPPYGYSQDHVIVLSDWSNTNPNQIFANLKKEGDYYSSRFPLQPSLSKFIHDYRYTDKVEREKLVADYKMMQTMRMSIYDLSDVAFDAFLLNGKPYYDPWVKHVSIGDTVRLRFIGAAGSTIFRVKIPGEVLQIVHVQGNDVKPYSVDNFSIAPGETYDVLVHIAKNKPYIIYAESVDKVGAAIGALITDRHQSINIKDVSPFPEPPPVTREMMANMMPPMEHHSMDDIQNHSVDVMQEHSMDDKKNHSMHDKQVHSMNDKQVHSVDDKQNHSMHDMQDHSMHDMQDHSMHDMQDHSMNDKQDHSMHDMQDHSMNDKQDHSMNDKQDHSMNDKQDHSMNDKQDHSNDKQNHSNDMPDHSMHDKQVHSMHDKQNHSMNDKQDHSHNDKQDHSHNDKQDHTTNNKQNHSMHNKQNHSMRHSPATHTMATEPSVIGDALLNPARASEFKTTPATKYANIIASIPTNDPNKPIKGIIRMELFGYMDRFIWFINGLPEYKAHPIILEPGERYRFVFTNTSMMHHPMHIHGHWFILRNGSGNYDPLLHTIDVAPGATMVADVDTDASGQWFFHCHLLYHMVAGMSRTFQYSTLLEIIQGTATPENIVQDTVFHNRPIVRVDKSRPIDSQLIKHPSAHHMGLFFATFLEVGEDPFHNVQKINYKGLYGADYDKLQLLTDDAEIHEGSIDNADIDIFYWRLLSQFWAIKGGINYFYRPALQPYWQLGMGLEGLFPYFIETDIRAYYYAGSAKLDAEFSRDSQLTNNFFLRLGVRSILATKTLYRAQLGRGLNQMRYVVRPYYRLAPGLNVFVEYEYEKYYGAFKKLQLTNGEATTDVTLAFGLSLLF